MSHPPHQTPPDQRVPLHKRIAYGFGALADNFIMNGFGTLVTPIYNIGLKLDPVLLGLAVAIPRVFDAISDPIMGNISDNTRSRWGRRRPYIVAGAVLSAILLPLIWMPPVISQNGMFLYLAMMGTIYFTTYTVFTIPYAALGFELTGDYDERTRLLAWPNYIGLIGSISMPWLYSIALLSFFGSEVVGARWVSVILAVLIIICALIPAVLLREPARAQMQEKVKLWDAIKATLSNRPYFIVLSVNVIVLLGLATMFALGLYINIYHVFDGDKAAAAKMSGISGSLTAALSYVSVFMATMISTRFGKRRAVEVGLVLSLIGSVSLWWTLTPAAPYLQLISAAFIGLGLQGCWMLFISMIGDVCEEDELRTGLRREGIYSAVGGFSRKLAVAAAAIGTGVVLKAAGFDAEIAETTGAPQEVIDRIRIYFVVGQVVVLLLGLFLLQFYPITRERAQETQRILRARRGTGTDPAQSP